MEATLAAALLHDTVEDTETTFDELEAEFGPEISKLVAELTDNKKLPKEERKRLQIEHAPSLSPTRKNREASRQDLQSKRRSTRSSSRMAPKRKHEYFDWAKSVIDKISGTNPNLENAFAKAYANRPKKLGLLFWIRNPQTRIVPIPSEREGVRVRLPRTRKGNSRVSTVVIRIA